jgi:hypothetical protein
MMRVLAGFVVAGPLQAILVIASFTVLSFLAPPLTSILSYGGAAALALYSLHAGARFGAVVLLAAMLVTGLLTEMLLHQGLTIAVTSLLLWILVWLAAVVLRETRSLAMGMLVLSALAMVGLVLIFVWFGDPTQLWLEHLRELINTLAAQPELQIDTDKWMRFAEQVAPFMTGSLAAGLSFAALACLMLGRWWQSLIVKPGALRKEFYALRLNRMLSLLAVAIFAVAALRFGSVSALALQWSLVVMVPFLFVGLAVVHATLANLKAGRMWLIIIYVLMSLLPQVMMLVVVTGLLDPWLDLRRRTEKSAAS